ncbi:MAG TPA: chromosome segregation protein SMC [Anaerohalosphaeraceae bacterium]|nr:chromosome segregation protein SMC [Anaerohalosphaeraceae bacterium]
MKLEKVVINGFKSFADKTELQFNQPITGIVGPNGCGKSNVVDAIKWVLGSQSPKSLRSGQMADVIFSGSSSRKPSGMAEVSLHFSGGQTLGLEQDELTITRRLFRSGESEYLLNGKSCRLRDIRNLFLDTGVGVSAYSIIEQGQIDQLLHASKVDRRIIFEEAAGISRFKVHKKEAERKLERAEQNLLRLADIINEVQRQLRSIKLQAGKARSFLEYTQRLKELRIRFSLAEFHKYKTQQKEKEQTLGQWQERFAQTAAEVSRLDAAESRLHSQLTQAEAEIGRWDNTLIAARSRIEQQIERIRFLKDRLSELQKRKNEANEQVRTISRQCSHFVESIETLREKLQAGEGRLHELNQRMQRQEEKIRQSSRFYAELQSQLDDEKSGILDIVRRTAQLHNEIQSLNTYRNNLSGQKTRLSGKAAQVQEQTAVWLTEKAQLQTRLEEIQSVLRQLNHTLSEQKASMEAVGQEEALLRKSLEQLKEQRSGLTAERNVLREMENRREGLNEAVKTILDRYRHNKQSGLIEGVLADILHTDVEYAPAVEAALGPALQALLVNDTRQFLDEKSIYSDLNSRLQVLCLDRFEPFRDFLDVREMNGVRGRLIEFVSFEEQYAPLCWSLLGKVLLVDSVETALDLAARLDREYQFVTLGGHLVSNGMLLSVGPLNQSAGAGLLSRKSRIEQIESVLNNLQEQISRQEEHLQQADQKYAHLSKVCQDLRTSIYEATAERVDTESRLRLIEQNLKRLTDEQPLIFEEMKQLEEEIQQSVRREHESQGKLKELEELNRQRTEQIAALQKSLDEKKTELEKETAALTDLKIQYGQAVEQQKSIHQQISSLQSQLQHSRIALQAARTEFHSSQEQIVQTERAVLKTESEMNRLYLEKETAQRQSRLLHKQIEALQAEQKESEQRLRQSRRVQQEIEESIHQIQIDLGQIQVRQEDLIQRVREELQMDLAAQYETFREEQTDWEAVQEEIRQLREKIERLGHVNVEAIDQQEELEKRAAFLSGQAEDLQQSKAQLMQLIERINRESREKFAATFEQVRTHFQQIFRKLFGGGKADIFLENPEDLLESGIEIVARPPGKETRTISLLSGGEKTMTAIALLFAVFQSKPSPFCVLDEVDAALDEANNERFNLIVQEFKQHSQFIIITHSKRTMSIADVLYGITMQMQGVSKKISVQFESIEKAADTAVA